MAHNGMAYFLWVWDVAEMNPGLPLVIASDMQAAKMRYCRIRSMLMTILIDLGAAKAMERREFLKSAAAVGATVALSRPELAVADTVATQKAATAQDLYPLGADSKQQTGVPAGKSFQFSMSDSRHYPETHRMIDVYVPAQYKAERPACVWVSLDGLSESTHFVFDNLIHRNEVPVTIAVGLHAGSTASAESSQNPRFNRSFEFDSLNDVLADFITEELLPEIEKRKTPDGLPILLSSDPNDRGITGGSTGGIGSFTVAWQRPDMFRRVFTKIGTFVGMRGGDRYPVLIRKTEPKPLRVYMQDGDKDGWPGGLELGDWWMSNQAVERALTFAGYQVEHAWGVGGHDGRQGESIMPDVLRWLWKDWPKPVQAGQTQNFAVQAIAKKGEDWEIAVNKNSLTRIMSQYLLRQVSIGRAGDIAGERPADFYASHLPAYYVSPSIINDRSTMAAIASDREGNVYVQNASDGSIFQMDAAGHAKTFAQVHAGDNGLAFGSDGTLYVAEINTARILAVSAAGKSTIVAEGIRGHRLTVTQKGNIYVTETGCCGGEDSARTGRIWLLRPDGSKSVIADGLDSPAGISLTPDGLWLCVTQSRGHHAYSYRVQPDGTLRHGEPFYWFHVPDSANDSGALQVCMDRQGWAYAATRMGIQVLDRNGRVTAILPVGSEQLAGICFGDADFQTLYVTTGNAVYRRRVKTTGAPSWESPIGLPPWNAA
jgi:gluconolactonase